MNSIANRIRMKTLAIVHSSASADAFVPGDIRAARIFGENFAKALHRISSDLPLALAPEPFR